MGKLQKSMTAYVKTLSKRNEGDDKEKSLPVSYLGSTMVSHGEDFEDDSEFGQCLQSKQRQGVNVTELTTEQAWAEPTNESAGFRKHMFKTRLRAGLSPWRGLLLR